MSQNTATTAATTSTAQVNTDKAASTLAKVIAGAGIDTALVAVLANQEISFTTEYTSEYTYFGKDLTTTWTITIGEGRVVATTNAKHFEAVATEVIAAMI